MPNAIHVRQIFGNTSNIFSPPARRFPGPGCRGTEASAHLRHDEPASDASHLSSVRSVDESAAIYLGLRALKGESESVLQYLWLGVCIGAAMLAKATSLLLIPPLLGALMIRLVQQRAPIFDWVRAFGITIGATFVTCGWHYLRIWRHFGTPIVGNWEAVLGFSWWQDPGFHTSGDYLRFGQSLVAPIFSGFNGFADGIYSTLWGDSLCGGLTGLLSRTPWNYQLMVGGYWLAFLPTLLVILGAAVMLYRFARQASPEWFLLFGLSAVITVALIFMTLRVPSYAQVKAFYGLSAIVPFCCFAVIGWQMLTARSRILQLIFGAAVIFFSINSFASVWIRPSTQQHIYVALRSISQSQWDRATAEATAATKSPASNASACYLLAAAFDVIGDSRKAIANSERGLELDPKRSSTHSRTSARERGCLRSCLHPGAQTSPRRRSARRWTRCTRCLAI